MKFEYPGRWTPRHVRLLSEDDELDEVFFADDVVSPSVFRQLNDVILAKRPGFGVRFNSDLKTPFNCDWLNHLPSVTSLSLESIFRFKPPFSLPALRCLKEIKIDVFDLDDFDFLADSRNV